MAEYKVPQDVEADDKLIGPFSFRQFVYLLISGGLVALGVGLFQIFPALAIIPLPFLLFFLALALPIKKDQPMETYLAALVSYYLKPHTRVWTPGQRDTTVLIAAPKVVEENRARDITSEEAVNRLSFLANIVDTQGYAIKGANTNSMREDVIAEANATTDMYDNYKMMNLGNIVNQDRQDRHNEAVQEMRNAINRRDEVDTSGAQIQNDRGMVKEREEIKEDVGQAEAINNMKAIDDWGNSVVVQPGLDDNENPEKPEENNTIKAKPSIIELANNTDFTVATIAKEANRLNRKDEGEVFISLH